MNWNVHIEVKLFQGQSEMEILRLHTREFVHEVHARSFFARLETLITALVALVK